MESRGRESLDKNYRAAAQAPNRSMPMIHNHLISISGNEAKGICSIEYRGTQQGKSIIGSGYYEDRYRRENGTWKFVSRDTTFFHWVPLQQGWATSN
jgi:hypothetical protein